MMSQRVSHHKKRRFSPARAWIIGSLRRIPFAYRLLKRMQVIFDYVLWRIRVRARKRSNQLDFDRIYWVAPRDVALCTPLEFHPLRYDGAVIDSDWDITDKRFEDLDVFRAFKTHFVDGVPWPETEFFKNTLRRISGGEVLWGCVNEEDLVERCAKIARLFDSICNNGYQPQTCNFRGFLGTHRMDEVSVNLSRNGELLFNNGAHRLALAKLLGVEKIPVRVTVCHSQCDDFSILQEC